MVQLPYFQIQAQTQVLYASSIPETQDQPTTITNYYLQRINGSDTSFTSPVFIRSDKQLQIYPTTTFQSLLQEWIRYTYVSSSDGYAISYIVTQQEIIEVQTLTKD